ncbi:hypothetical protein [Fusobacterium gastrosuis]|uniref:hypothetical protein n=1 Tax=Fusobacterium gastrosuis TaxID=1755100 RepID=UPI002978BAEF|nr:hypothetical protein [Fusobacteriaceae bacterium]MDY5714098.1 hypothetical protein [Fusobacterium gastrosuis]
MEETKKKEKFYSDGIIENSKRFSQEVEAIEKEEIIDLKDKKPFLIKNKEIENFTREEIKRNEIENNSNIKVEKDLFKDINKDGKPDYINEQENHTIILKRKKENLIKKKRKKEREVESLEREMSK